MHQYILDTKYASGKLLWILNKERDFLNKKLLSRKTRLETEKKLFDSMQKNGFTPQGIMDLYGLNKASEKLWKEAEQILSFIVANTNSLSIIAGAILQIAKQGISFKYKSISKCPDGRVIGRETLKNIIWQGRNQAMHFEEEGYNEYVKKCFKNLAIDFGNRFSLSDKNLAYDVIMLLDWTSYAVYEKDMTLLLG